MVKNDEKTESVELLDEGDEELQDDQFLTFILGDETYALDLLNVKEILQLMPITPLPQTLDYIKGIINLRGKIIPVMDVRKRFGIEDRPYEERTCIVVVTVDELSMGLVVDHVSEVIEIKSEQIDVLSSQSQATAQRFVRGIGKTDNGVKIILDLEKLLSDETFNLMKAA